MGPLSQVLSMIPGMNAKAMQGFDEDAGDKRMRMVEAIINSMTLAERDEPSIINGSRRKRIAAGSGTTVQEVNRLLRDFESIRKMFKMMTETGKVRGKKFRNMQMPF
jgi:signal recognition particle subunit SRP54